MSANILTRNLMTQAEKIKISCADGVQLSAILCIGAQPKAVVMLSGGTGFKKEFYLPIAHYLAEHELATMVYDYRGTGESKPENMRNCDYKFLDCGQKDMPAVLDFLDNRFPDLPKLILGHSAGGQQVGFIPNLHKVKGLVAVATSVGYLPFMPLGYRLKSYYFFYLFSPVSVLLKGYVAAKRFNIMEDLPRKLVAEWRRWCSKPAYFFDPKFYGKSVPKGAFEALPFPVHVFWATDDPISNVRSVPAFWKHVKSKVGLSFQVLRPEDWNTKKIDHHGMFRAQFKDSIWREILGALQRMV